MHHHAHNLTNSQLMYSGMGYLSFYIVIPCLLSHLLIKCNHSQTLLLNNMLLPITMKCIKQFPVFLGKKKTFQYCHNVIMKLCQGGYFNFLFNIV